MHYHKIFRQKLNISVTFGVGVFIIGSIGSFYSSCALAITVDDAIVMAYENNAGIKADRATYEAEKSSKFDALSEFLPRINAQHSNNKVKYKDPLVESSNQYPKTRSYGATVKQPIFDGGASVLRMQAASKVVSAAYLKLKASAHSLAADVVEAYEKVRASKEIYTLNCDNQEVFEKHLEYVKIRFKAGVVTMTDVLQAEVRLQDAKAQKERAWAGKLNAEAAFERIVGTAPNDEMKPIDMNNFILPADVEEFVFAVRTQNPTLQAKALESEIADKNVKREVAQLSPSVSAVAQFNRLHNANSINAQSNSDTYALQVSIPILQGGAEYSAIRRKRYIAKSSALSKTDTENKMREYSLALWNNYNTNVVVVKARQAGIDAAEKALDGVKEEVAFGTRTTLDLLNAQREVFDAKVAHRSAQMEMVVARFRMLQTMGRVEAIDAVLEE